MSNDENLDDLADDFAETFDLIDRYVAKLLTPEELKIRRQAIELMVEIRRYLKSL